METKIQATERLRREGRWNFAQSCRESERQRLLDSGSTRREARDLSWKAMIEDFPPLTAEEIDWYPAVEFLAMAKMPPECELLDGPDEPRFAEVWSIACTLLASDHRRRQGDDEGAIEILGWMWMDASTPYAKRASFVALTGQESLVDEIEAKFKAVIDRLSQAGIEPRIQKELEVFVCELDRFHQGEESDCHISA